MGLDVIDEGLRQSERPQSTVLFAISYELPWNRSERCLRANTVPRPWSALWGLLSNPAGCVRYATFLRRLMIERGPLGFQGYLIFRIGRPVRRLVFGFPLLAAPPLRDISNLRCGLNAKARALAAFRAFSDRCSGVKGGRLILGWRIFCCSGGGGSLTTASRTIARATFPASSAARADRYPPCDTLLRSGLLLQRISQTQWFGCAPRRETKT
jgi:hypothetical protein